MTLFTSTCVAEGYARHRPPFHPEVMGTIRAVLQLREKVRHALDVGCGTGLSPRPLTTIAARVIGVDPSIAMSRMAHQAAHVQYRVASAEHLPFANTTFDVMTAAGALDWIDRPLFLSEARRLLITAGWLIIDDVAELGTMVGNAACARWYTTQYVSKYPKPPRNTQPLSRVEAQQGGFDFTYDDRFVLALPFSLESSIQYTLPQSTITAAVEERGEDIGPSPRG
jgi:ubiquinone/menaquinone biosynthesis C-methylase UbiE